METKLEAQEKDTGAVIKDLRNRFFQTRQKTREICHPLHLEDYSAQPIMDVSPPKWHLGHTTWFFENFVLVEEVEDYKPYNPGYFFLFNSYYEAAGERINRAERGTLTRPPVEDIYNYRSYVDEHIFELLDNANGDLPHKLLKTIELGLNHEQQHQELLLTDIKYILGVNPLFPAYLEQGQEELIGLPAEHPMENYIEIQEGIYEIGHKGNSFAYDNEGLAHKVFLHSFNFSERLVTNQEYLEFMEDGGYEKFQYWLQEGWEWIKLNGIKSPLYWQKVDGQWYNFTMRGLSKLNPYEPVCHVSYYEADAFARWKGKRLLTEFEWEVAAKALYKEIPDNANFLEGNNFHPLHRQNFSSQMYGDVWEWCCSAYLPYPGFRAEEGAIGEYNGKFMINQMVLRGGSCATPQSHIRPTYRNFFQPDKRWQFSGIRLADILT
jgi:ergothioneine biosynthesis protein EgtB